MATLKEVDPTAVNGSDNKEPPTEEDAAEEQAPERRHVDALLDISEEGFTQELEPYEYHCYSGWEEAVHGWARAAPLSCILLTQKRYRKPKHKEADNPTPLPVDPTTRDASSSASITEHRCETHVGPHNSFEKTMPLNQHTRSSSNTAVTALQRDTSEWPVLGAMQKTMSNLLLREEEGETPLQPHHLPSKYSENKPTKPQKHRHRPNNIVIPIKNFTFLPPIKTEENGLFDKKSGTRGTRADPIANPELPAYSAAALTSKYRTCQHNPHLFSAVSLSIPKRYQVPMSSKPDTVHRTTYSLGKSLTQALHSSAAAGAQAHMHPSKTVCL